MVKFHPGELAAQRKAGTLGVASELGRGIGKRLSLSTGLNRLFRSSRFVILSSIDNDGAVWVSPLFGEPGFLKAESECIVRVQLEGCLTSMDPLTENVEGMKDVAILAIDFEKRLRYRTTGIAVIDYDSKMILKLDVKEAFPNCPKYIQRRVIEPRSVKQSAIVSNASQSWDSSLSSHDMELISKADTLFLGTYYQEAGADVNHRGGYPGFVRISSPTEIFWPEYRGNGMFQSDGNLEMNDHAGLCFVDFATGDLLQITGTATVEWNTREEIDGVCKVLRFRITKVLRSFCATNYRWKLKDYSLYNPIVTGVDAKMEDVGSISSFPMDVTLVKITEESPLVKTFRFLAPRIVSFLPGQYATFEFKGIPSLESGSRLERTWTISETPSSIDGDNSVEISVKKKLGGIVSTWLHEYVKIGQRVRLLGIDGEMTPIVKKRSEHENDMQFTAPPSMLLISGGIGITPIFAILRGLGAFKLSSDVVLLHSERHEEDLPFQRELKRRAEEYPTIKLINAISACNSRSQLKDQSINRCGRITKEMIAEHVPNLQNRVVYLCGPESFMQVISKALVDLGVDANNINIEKFDF